VLKLKTNQRYFAIFLGIVALTSIVYFDGLIYSIFLLDDFPNLQRLTIINSLYDWEGILSYSLNGIAGTTGRPISLFTFSLQASSWPQNPFHFKLINFGIHIVNGYLVYSILLVILKQHKSFSNKKSSTLALVGALIWLLHPIQVSTVLYTVQRMTELSALFVLTGMYIYLRGRTKLANDNSSYIGIILITAAVVIGAYVGILAKENAILLCLYIAVIEGTIFSNSTYKYRKAWSFIFLYTPLLFLFGYLIYKSYPYILTDFPIRNFSAYERLLTQSRVIVDYIVLIIAPTPNKFGLFHTDYDISSSFFSLPVITSVIIITFLLGLALKVRKSHPIFSLGVLLFFSAHVLESTFVNLEMYFEHRNYFAIMGIIISLLYAYGKLVENIHFKKLSLYTINVGASIWILIIVFITHNEIKLWSNPITQAETWYKFNPESDRARGHYNNLLTTFGLYKQAYGNYRDIFKSDINDPGAILLWTELRCKDKSIPYPPHDLALEKLSNANYSNAVIGTLDEIIRNKEDGKCQNIDSKVILEYVDALFQSRHYQNPKQLRLLYILKSNLISLDGKTAEAIELLKSADGIKSSPDTIISIASLYYLLANFDEFSREMYRLQMYCDSNRIKCNEYRKEIEILTKAQYPIQ